MKTLLFKVNVHNTEKIDIPGEDEPRAVNLTVRKGFKWGVLKAGEVVELRETGDDTVRHAHQHVSDSGHDDELVTATIYDVKVMSFNDLMSYPRMLLLEHDPACQTYKGLYEVMRRVYDGFLAHELVTLVFYEVVQ